MASVSRKCNACAKPLRSQEFMECSNCGEIYDLPCINIKKHDFTKFTPEIKNQWSCPACKNKQPKQDNSNTPIRNISMEISETITSRNVNTIRGTQSNVIKKIDTEETLSSIVTELRKLREDMNEMRNTINMISDTLTCIEEIEKKNRERDREITDLKIHIEGMQDIIDLQAQQLIKNELEIIGIPETNNENLYHMAVVTAKMAGVEITENDIDEVYRVGKTRTQLENCERPTRPIVIRLLRKSKSQELLKAAKSRKNLSSANIVSGKPNTIYINERLTTKNRRLFREARVCSRNHGFRFCWHKDGAIYIRKAEKTAAVRIRSAMDLKDKIGPLDLKSPSNS